MITFENVLRSPLRWRGDEPMREEQEVRWRKSGNCGGECAEGKWIPCGLQEHFITFST